MKNFTSGIQINQKNYKSFQPEKIHKNWLLDDMDIINLLPKADRVLGRLDMYSEHIPNIDIFIRMHVFKEATQSSKIESTQTNIEEAISNKNSISDEKKDDWQEIQNYVEAMNNAIELLQTIPLSSRLLKMTHKTLLNSVRGANKLPGEFRKSQNWIGGSSINNALFVPPVCTSIGDLMSDLEHFVHNEEMQIPDLIKIAIIHYQFETIHPFLDGNGRVGRLMIAIYLVEKGILKRPILYLSSFFEKHRLLYYENLTNVRENNNIKQWVKFFLIGVTETSEKGVVTFDKILKLKTQTEQQIQNLGPKAGNAQKILYHLFEQPVVSVGDIERITGVSKRTAYNLVADLQTIGILKKSVQRKRDRLYSFHTYLELFN